MTIERKEEINPEFHGQLQDWIFGCDICQDVCPWNRNSVSHDEPKLDPRIELLKMTKPSWEYLLKEEFDELFAGSAVKRAGFEGVLKNKKALTKPVL
jgi:epoxyqueuosine reductase